MPVLHDEGRLMGALRTCFVCLNCREVAVLRGDIANIAASAFLLGDRPCFQLAHGVVTAKTLLELSCV